MRHTVIVGGQRTAFGKLGGMFKDVKAVELGAAAINGAMLQSGIKAAQVDVVMMGMVLQAGCGQNPARQAARLAGLDWQVPSDTINKVCASGLRAITLAEQIIRAGDADTIVAGGMESMSQTPFAVRTARWGSRLGHTELTDLLLHDGLLCPFDDVLMAVHGNQNASEHGISRSEQDAWALRSHVRASAAIQQGFFAEEITGVSQSRGSLPNLDESPRPDASLEQLARLKPIHNVNSTITAGNAPGVNDGAAALVLMSNEEAIRTGSQSLAKIIGHSTIGTEPPYLAAAPALAIQKLLRKTGASIEDIDLFEVNEAFASVVLICGKILDWDTEKVNVNGGAIALGHPIGASGARILLSLVNELRRRGGGLGIAAICSGGAQGDAVMIEVQG
ncbi:acetyl-CoA acetyltransferase [Paenibacillus sp. FSL H8-0548]|uniref:acetyl-CoA C-acetyltransferase n=1 Tax=Paenibacillus sp. FSL H8-0548 TaxID=1920422 RepID=UPI00096E0C46|nr:acetyl-CoA C-acetyltransferase [Paenibacillus sp. FSL H8-0548]OMF38412.1 acetyl-CoA acetyltransferase [Paenibacillus sp. FSL H8-0548]